MQMSRETGPEIWNFQEASECMEGAVTILTSSLVAMQTQPQSSDLLTAGRARQCLSTSTLTGTLVRNPGF